MKILSAVEFLKIKARICELLNAAQNDFILTPPYNISAEQEKLSILRLQLQQARPELEALTARISPYIIEEYGDDWIIEKFKSNLDRLCAMPDSEKMDSNHTYKSSSQQLDELIKIFT